MTDSEELLVLNKSYSALDSFYLYICYDYYKKPSRRNILVHMIWFMAR